MNDNPSFSRIGPLILMAVGLVIAVFVGYLVGTGSWADVYVPVLAALGIGSVLWLGSRYWLLIPFSLSFSAPIIPLGNRAVELPEITIAVCAVIFLARVALKNQIFHVWRRDHVPFLLYAGWAAIIYFHNPIGFTVFGATSGGARFYLKIFLALVAFLIIANQKITNQDCKWILVVTVIGAALDFGKTLFYFYLIGGSAAFVDPLENYTWQQQMAVVPLAIVLILFSRYRTSEIFNLTNIWKVFLLFICIPIILLSGKRSAVACLVLYPIVAALCRKEFRYVFLWTGCALLAALILVIGHGTLFNLPFTAQRSLSWLPGRWDSQLAYMEGGKDIFREKLRSLAMEKIRQHPWIGEGYDVNAESSNRLSLTMANKSDALITQMAIGSQWHNRWLGDAADFGIPATILVGVIFVFVISRAQRALPRLPAGSLLQTLVMFILIKAVVDVFTSHVGGHSAIDAFDRWWMYGALVSIAGTITYQKRLPGRLMHMPLRMPERLGPATPVPSMNR